MVNYIFLSFCLRESFVIAKIETRAQLELCFFRDVAFFCLLLSCKFRKFVYNKLHVTYCSNLKFSLHL